MDRSAATGASDSRRVLSPCRRYTFADLTRDLQHQTRDVHWEPMRDWFPMSAYSVIGNVFDHLNPTASVGSMFADAHPSQAIFSPLLVNQRTRDVLPLASFVNVEQLLEDLVHITDHGRGSGWIKARLPLAILRNFDGREGTWRALDLPTWRVSSNSSCRGSEVMPRIGTPRTTRIPSGGC